MKKLKFKLACIFFPKYIMSEAFHRGQIYERNSSMMDYGILVHSPEKQKEILEAMSFESWFEKFKKNY